MSSCSCHERADVANSVGDSVHDGFHLTVQEVVDLVLDQQRTQTVGVVHVRGRVTSDFNSVWLIPSQKMGSIVLLPFDVSLTRSVVECTIEKENGPVGINRAKPTGKDREAQECVGRPKFLGTNRDASMQATRPFRRGGAKGGNSGNPNCKMECGRW